MESAGVSRAIGIAPPRYEGVQYAIRMARELSKENVGMSSNHQVKMERGPRPQYIPRNPSYPSMISESERQSIQYKQDIEKGLQAVYGQKRRMNAPVDIFDNGPGSYNVVPQSRYRENSNSRHSDIYQRII